MKTYHIIANPVAGKTRALKNLKIAEGVFSANGAAFQTYTSTGVGDARRIAEKLTMAGEKEIIALGGDGTLHEVLNGLVDPTACHLGLIPSGTGNDFSEKIGLPLDAERTANLILKGESKLTDYLEVGGVRCMNVAGVGIDVDVLERCKRGKLKGKIKYLLSLVQSLFTFKGIKIQMESDGREEERDVLIAAACNGSQFGGGIKICPKADVEDGKINAVLVDQIGGVFKIIKAFTWLMKGKILEYPKTMHFLCERLKFLTQKPCPVQLDGEIYKDLTFDVQIKKGLNFYR